MQFRRYAVYHLPEGPLGDFGGAWLGWDARNGLRPLRPGGLPPEAETRLEVSLAVGDEVVHLHGLVVRQQAQSPRWLLSMKFLDVPEREGNVLRRRVFQALREERAAAE